MQASDGVNLGGVLLFLLVIWLLSRDGQSSPQPPYSSYDSYGPRSTGSFASDLDANAIGRMKDGDTGWTVPWALSLNDGTEGINGRYHCLAEAGGTVEMRIERKDGVIHAWPPEDAREYVGSWNFAVVVPVCIHWPATIDNGAKEATHERSP